MSKRKRKAGRIIAWSLGGLLGFIILLVLLAYLFRGAIITKVLKDYNEGIPGELSAELVRILPLKSLPLAELHLNKLVLSGPSDSTGLGGEPILEAEELRAELDLRNLLRGNFRIPWIYLGKGQVHYQVGANQLSNLELALGISMAPDTLGRPEEEKEARIIELEAFVLEDFHFIWSDSLRDLYSDLFLHELGASFSSLPDTVEGDLKLLIDINEFKYQKYRIKEENDIIFSGGLLMDQPNEKVRIDSSFLRISGLELRSKGEVGYGNDSQIDMEFEALNQGIEVLNYLLKGILDLDEIEQRGSGRLGFSGSLRGPYKDQMPVLEVRGVADQLSFLIKPIDREVTDISFDFYATNGRHNDMSEAEVRVENFSANFPEGEVGGNFHLKNMVIPAIDLEIQGALELAGLEHMLSLDSIRDLSGSLALEGKINGILDEGSGEFLNDAGELGVTVTDMGFIAGRDTLKDINGEFYVQKNLAGLKNLSMEYNGSKVDLEAKVEDIMVYILGYKKDITASIGASSDLILPGRITHDTILSNILGEELRGLYFEASAQISHEELDAFFKEDSIPEMHFKLDSFGIELPEFADISNMKAGITFERDTLHFHYLEGTVGESQFHFTGNLAGYRSLIEPDSGNLLAASFSISSPLMRAEDFFTWGEDNFILPEQYQSEYLENLRISGEFSLPAEGILLDSMPLDFQGNIHELEWKFRYYPMAFEQFSIDVRKVGDVVYLDEFKGIIGRSDINLVARIQNVGDSLMENMTGNLVLESNLLDLNELMNFRSDDEAEEAPLSDTVVVKDPPALDQISYPNFQFDLNIGELNYGSYTVKGIDGKMRSSREKVFYMDNFQTNSESGGLLEFTGQLSVADPGNYNFSAQVDLTDVNLHDLDFEMQAGDEVYTLKENFAGVVSGTGMAEVFFTPGLKLDIPRTTALFHVEVKEGELINFTPLQAAGKYLDNRNLNHVRFSTLRNSFTLMDSKIIVPLMIVESTLGQLLIEGEQGLDNTYLYLLYIPMELVRDAARSVMTAEEGDGEEDEIQRMQMQKVMILTPWSNGKESGVRLGDKRDKYR